MKWIPIETKELLDNAQKGDLLFQSNDSAPATVDSLGNLFSITGIVGDMFNARDFHKNAIHGFLRQTLVKNNWYISPQPSPAPPAAS